MNKWFFFTFKLNKKKKKEKKKKTIKFAETPRGPWQEKGMTHA